MKKSLLNLQELIAAVKGEVISENKECCFTSVQTDSRNVEKDTLFVPLVGEFQNGHKYIPQALDKGASVVFVNKYDYEITPDVYKKMCIENPFASIIIVENTLQALQNAAEAYVSKFPEMIKISITGSSGKTTTKEMAVSVVKEFYGEENVAYTKGNFNSETGLPLSVFKIRGNEKIGIFEMGMNRENEIGEISKVLKSKYGIITNIGTAHIGILGSRENIAKEKRKSFAYIPDNGAVFVPADDDFADYCTENVKGKIIKYGKSVSEKESGVCFISDNGLDGTSFSVDGLRINLPLSGEYNYQNALGIVALAKELSIPVDVIKKGLENVSAVSGRMEAKKIVLKNSKEVTLIADCYNANPDSMGKVIDFCSKLKNSGKRIYVLGDMKELGEESETAHKKIGQKIVSGNVDFICLVGKEMKSCYDYCNDYLKEKLAVEKREIPLFYFEDNSEDNFIKIAEQILSFSSDKDIILFKGSHSMALEKIIPLLEQNKEETSL